MTPAAADVAGARGTAIELRVWRHPRPFDAIGRCIGRTDLSVDRRRAARLARRIASVAQREALAREIWTSPLTRCAAVGRMLTRRSGFLHRVDARLLELDFGSWEGKRWSEIPPAEVAQWEADFAHFAPGGGESLLALHERVQKFVDERVLRDATGGGTVLLVGHAGWDQRSAPLERTAARVSGLAGAYRLRLFGSDTLERIQLRHGDRSDVWARVTAPGSWHPTTFAGRARRTSISTSHTAWSAKKDAALLIDAAECGHNAVLQAGVIQTRGNVLAVLPLRSGHLRTGLYGLCKAKHRQAVMTATNATIEQCQGGRPAQISFLRRRRETSAGTYCTLEIPHLSARHSDSPITGYGL